MTAKPPFADDWEGLAAVAERLRDDRAAGDPPLVEAGRLTAQQATDRARVSDALARQWRAIARREPLAWLNAGNAEILADLAEVAAAAAARAERAPNASVQLGGAQLPWPRYAQAIAALLWHQQPYRAGADMARIVFIHTINQQMRAERASRVAAPAAPSALEPVGDHHVNRSAARANPLQQAAARQSNAAATQAGLF